MFAVPPNTVVESTDRVLAHPARIAARHAHARHAWASMLRYDTEQRWAGLLERTERYEAWLLSWLPGQETERHDHGGATGAFTVVAGTLTEWTFRDATDGVCRTIGTGQSRVFGPNYVHQVRNEGPDPAISIHVYEPQRASHQRFV